MTDDISDGAAPFRFTPEVYPSKNMFRYRPSVTDAQCWIVGLIVCQWQMIEFYMSTHCFRLTDGDVSATEKFRDLRNFEKQRDMWKELVSNFEPEPKRSQILKIIEEIGSIKTDRDRIVHGLLIGSDPNDGSPQGETGMATELAKTKRRNFEWKFSFDRLRRTSIKLDQIIYRYVETQGLFS